MEKKELLEKLKQIKIAQRRLFFRRAKWDELTTVELHLELLEDEVIEKLDKLRQ